MTDKTKNRWLAALCLIFLLSLVPLYALGSYAHPSVDDYYYGVETAARWQESGSIGDTAAESWRLMKDSYENWQGNFAAIFLMRLQPGIFGEKAYALTCVILLTSLALSTLFFFYTALRRLLFASRRTSLAVSLCLSFCLIQFTYKPSDSFYWFNGGIYYTFFFSLSYVMLALVLWGAAARRAAGRAAAVLGAVLLAFLVGGGNYSTALSCAVLLACALLWLLLPERLTGPVRTEGSVRRRRLLAAGLPLAALLCSLMLSVLAPGNAVRQSVVGAGPGVLRALIYSFAYAGYSLADGFSVPVLALWLLISPLLYRLADRAHRRGFPFRCPLAVILVAFGIYASQGTALFYAQGLRMPPRMSNIIYFNSYFFTGFSLIYLFGWIATRFPDNPLARFSSALPEKTKLFDRFALALCLLFAFGCVGLCNVTENASGGAHFSLEPLSVSASYSLLKGEAQRYDEEMTARAAYLKAQPEGSDAAVSALSVYPEALVHSEITEDPVDFKNEHLAMYYHLGSVTLTEE